MPGETVMIDLTFLKDHFITNGMTGKSWEVTSAN
jgi:hypothetical protein